MRVFRAGGRTGAPVAEEREAGSGGGGDAANLGDAGHRVLGFLLRRFGGRRRRALWALGRVVWWKRLAGRCAVVRTRRRFWSVVTKNARSDREKKTKKLEGKARSYSYTENCARATAGVSGAMATGDDASPRGFYSAEAADEDRVWRRHAPAPELESTTARFRAADLAGDLPKIPRPESRCVAGTTWSGSRGACVADAIDARYAREASTTGGAGGGFDFRAHFPAVLSLLLAFSVCVVVVATSLLLAFALARAGSSALARGARRIKKIARRVQEEMTRKMKEVDDPARSRRAGYAAAAAATIGALAEICARLLGWIHEGLHETYARAHAASRTPASHDASRGDDDDVDPPRGVELGAIVGAALAAHVPSGPGGLNRERVRSCATQTARDLARRLVRPRGGRGGARDGADDEEFVGAFVGACELAWREGVASQTTTTTTTTTKKKKKKKISSESRANAEPGDGAGESRSSSTTSSPVVVEASTVTGNGSRDGSPSGATGSASTTTSDDEHMRPARRETETNRRVTPTNEEVVEHEGPSPGGSWFQGLAKTWETMTAGPAEHATARDGGGRGKKKNREDPEEPDDRKRSSEWDSDSDDEDDGVVGSVTASPETPSRGLALPGRGGSPRSAMRSIMRAASSADDKQLRVLDMAVRMREVLSSERANDIAEKRLDLSARALEAQRLNLDAAHEANELHSEANTIAKSSLQRKDVAARKAEAEKALGETRAALADAFYAGLVVVLCTTLAGGWRRAMAALDSVIGVCPRPAGGTGFSGAAWAIVGGGPGPLDYAWCVTRAFVRAALGGLLLLFVGWKLLQYNVVTNYQSAPAFVLLVVLGGGCGQLGRSAVDSLGGDGDLWLRMWGGYMCAAAACTWRADFVTLVCGKIGPVGRLVFYAAFGALAPFCVGAAPFEDTFGAFAESLADRAMFLGETAARAVEDAGEIIGFGFLWGPAGR